MTQPAEGHRLFSHSGDAVMEADPSTDREGCACPEDDDRSVPMTVPPA